jgi:hypothetical protein
MPQVRHYSPDCPTPAISLVQHAYVITQDVNGESKYIPIPKSWVLLDSQSSISVINSTHMVTNIRESPHPICAQIHGGSQTSTLIADFKILGTVWYNPEYIANIISLSQVRNYVASQWIPRKNLQWCYTNKIGLV